MSESLPHDLPPLITRYRRRYALGTAMAVVVTLTTVGAVWFYFVRAPGPRSVCDHVEGLRRQFPQDSRSLEDAFAPQAVGGSDQPVTPSTDQLCMWFFTTEQKQRSFVAYGQLSRCMTFAETPQELLSCIY